MFNSPAGGTEFREAIIAKLSPGEQLVSFADCCEGQWQMDPQGVWYPAGVIWYFLAVTNINVRQGEWKWERDSYKNGLFSSRIYTMTPTPEIAMMTAIALDDIVSSSHSSGPFDPHLSIWMQEWLGEGIAKPDDWWLHGCHLKLTLTNSNSIDLSAPFTEMEQLVSDIDAAKSGALIVKNTTAAASALDQLVPLLNDGILTQEEFDRAKDGFLGANVEVRESSVGLLRQLHSLHKSGVLSESEFNLKKWDILSKDG